ncbi:hypothetical protein B0H19DRAFT_1256332 [Mycena capillaripes]|nr:hypothetical protein B0H19DRAFT_1256332 [Mycena capillaripes]
MLSRRTLSSNDGPTPDLRPTLSTALTSAIVALSAARPHPHPVTFASPLLPSSSDAEATHIDIDDLGFGRCASHLGLGFVRTLTMTRGTGRWRRGRREERPRVIGVLRVAHTLTHLVRLVRLGVLILGCGSEYEHRYKHNAVIRARPATRPQKEVLS